MKKIPQFVKDKLFKKHPPGTSEKNDHSNRKNKVNGNAYFVNSGDVGGDLIINVPPEAATKKEHINTDNDELRKKESENNIKTAATGVIIVLAFSVILVLVFMCVKSNPSCFIAFCTAFGKFMDFLINLTNFDK